MTLAACIAKDTDSSKKRTPANVGVTEPPGSALAVPTGVLGRPVALPGSDLEVTTTLEPIPVFKGAQASTPDEQVNADTLKGVGLPVRVRITVTNRGSAPFDLSRLFVRDFVGTTSGKSAIHTVWTNLRQEKLAGLVTPGSNGTGTDSYTVPPEVADGFRITIAVQHGPPGPAGPAAPVGPVPDVVVTGKLDLPNA
ncbi:hypothetical protein [Embleya sp. AB8]|uniref:hypothetical protein n=1 Tax=Embleya sp. AB8 TaxID=3156304 RepID=UPI003C7779D8